MEEIEVNFEMEAQGKAEEEKLITIPLQNVMEGSAYAQKAPSLARSDGLRYLDERSAAITSRENFDVNMYAAKKSAANGLLDLALLMANVTQLKRVVESEGSHPFYILMLALLGSSIVLQVILGIFMLYLGRVHVVPDINELEGLSANNNGPRTRRRADTLNNIVVLGVFILTVINVFIAAFGTTKS